MTTDLDGWLARQSLSTGVARDLSIAAEAALAGGEAAMHHYGRADLAVRDKGIDDPVTEADRAADRAIRRALTERAPRDRLLSEETAATLSEAPSERLWVVDPLDGTKEFLARNGEFSVMVGLAVAGRARVGAVYRPARNTLYLGATTGGAWAVAGPRHRPIARRLEVPGAVPRPLRLAVSRSHGDPALERLIAELGEIALVRSGSVGIKCALVAAGEVDLYVHPVPYLKEWDTCAPEAVLRGAGGRVTDCGGRRLAYGKREPRQPRGIFAGQPRACREAAGAVRAAAAAMLEPGDRRSKG